MISDGESLTSSVASNYIEPPIFSRAQRRAIKARNRKTFERIKKARAKMQRQVGYNGQDYKVICEYQGQPDFCVGWTNSPSPGALYRMIEQHPSMSNPRIVKLTEEEKAALNSPK